MEIGVIPYSISFLFKPELVVYNRLNCDWTVNFAARPCANLRL